jgi:hypothetical protein
MAELVVLNIQVSKYKQLLKRAIIENNYEQFLSMLCFVYVCLCVGGNRATMERNDFSTFRR